MEEITSVQEENSESIEEFQSAEEDQIAQSVNQLIIVSGTGSRAEVSMHGKDGDGNWSEIMSTSGYVGLAGIGTASENATYTPRGVFTLSTAFGIGADPGSSIGYTQVDDTYYWVDDVNSSLYNRFVTTKTQDASQWNSAEHIVDYPVQYEYVVSIDYNTQCVPGAGSAIFLHCSSGNPTAGCVAIPREQMIFVLTHLQQDCRIVIDTQDNIVNY